MAKPKLIAFDLDYTLWPFWVDTHVDPPFRKTPRGDVLDQRGTKVKHYPEVPKVLQKLSSKGYDLAVVSRTGEVRGANQLLQLYGWERFFKFKEIYPGQKTKHFERLHSKSGVEYNQMLFFDDEMRNIRDVSTLGVTCIFVQDGTTESVVENGLKEFSKNAESAETKQ
ncbi:magnesium-dependent phosphatase 1-like [Ischnura elegans]|uniref:magnesium-dependent phosphatase 1-like n=1 Tax=Ischnura elegans TaxID=197161 RepID=UPI001ED8988B|nr:magnesium-dependent phosphatase 1-like [Ischnura elegans]